MCLSVCRFVLVFFGPFGVAITSLVGVGGGRGVEAGLGAFRAFVRFVLVWVCRFPLGVWEGLRFVIVALPGLFSYLFCNCGTLWIFLLPFYRYGTVVSWLPNLELHKGTICISMVIFL